MKKKFDLREDSHYIHIFILKQYFHSNLAEGWWWRSKKKKKKGEELEDVPGVQVLLDQKDARRFVCGWMGG